jgi:hypothetical protein
MHPER